MKSQPMHWPLLTLLLLVMIGTRLPMLGPAFHLEDASWAVFFLAGFYFREQWRWAFPLFMAVAVAVDYVAIQYLGISNYCVTVAYWFIVPSYAALWFGGSWFRRRLSIDVRGALLLAASLFVSASACFLLSNATFYWLGDKVAQPSWEGWLANLATWYGPFLQTSFAYVAVAALAHLIVAYARQISTPHTMGRR